MPVSARGAASTSAAKIQIWIGVRFERGLSASRSISQLGSPLGGIASSQGKLPQKILNI